MRFKQDDKKQLFDVSKTLLPLSYIINLPLSAATYSYVHRIHSNHEWPNIGPRISQIRERKVE